jgi:pimeloyl-ACP methyl ester carboxylesterase
MAEITISELTFQYELIGNPKNPVLVAIMGFIDQLHHWPDRICEDLEKANYCTLRFECRDCGLSTNLDELGAPDIAAMRAAFKRGEEPSMPYTLLDLANDVKNLMAALEIPRAHLLGYSMGGYVAQILAARDPELVESLVLLMTSSRAPGLQERTKDAAVASFNVTQSYTNHEEAVQRIFDLVMAANGSKFYLTKDEALDFAENLVARRYNPDGAARQIAAVLTTPLFLEELSRITCPVTIIHGTDDAIIPVEHGMDLKERLPHAKLEIVEGAGHEISPSLEPVLTRLILQHLGQI